MKLVRKLYEGTFISDLCNGSLTLNTTVNCISYTYPCIGTLVKEYGMNKWLNPREIVRNFYVDWVKPSSKYGMDEWLYPYITMDVIIYLSSNLSCILKFARVIDCLVH